MSALRPRKAKDDQPEQAPKNRAKWEKGVSQRPNGTFTFRWRDPETRRQKAKDFRSYAEAAAFSRLTRQQLADGTWRDDSGARTPFREYAAAFRARKVRTGEWGPRTVLVFDRMVGNLDRFGLADRPLGKIREEDVVAWLHWLNTEAKDGRGLSPNTIDLLVGQLRAVLAYAVKRGQLTVNVARGLDVKLPKVTGRRAAVREEEVPTDDQLARIKAAMPERYRLVVTLGAAVGLRSGEARGLRVRDFHALRRRVEVVQQLVDVPGRPGQHPAPPKTDESRRYVPLTDETVQEIAAHLARFRPGAQGDDLILAQENGEPLDDGRLNYHWTRACVAAGVRGHVFHQTRHRFATNLLANGIDVISVARLMGHKTADQVIRRYGHVTEDYMDRARDALAGKAGARRRG